MPCGDSALEVSERERLATFERLWEAGGLRFWTGNYTDVLQDEVANRMAYDFWRDKVRARIADPEIAELLAPAEPPHPFGVKRPSLEQTYYDVFDRPHVDLVDLRTTPIECITPDGVRTSAADLDFDVIVMATGFDAVTGGMTSIDIVGTDVSLADSWSGGVHTQLGIASSTFPNLFFVYGPQSPSGFCNGPTCAEVQGDLLVDVLADLRDRGVTRIEARPEAEQAWGDVVRAIGEATLFPAPTPGTWAPTCRASDVSCSTSPVCTSTATCVPRPSRTTSEVSTRTELAGRSCVLRARSGCRSYLRPDGERVASRAGGGDSSPPRALARGGRRRLRR